MSSQIDMLRQEINSLTLFSGILAKSQSGMWT